MNIEYHYWVTGVIAHLAGFGDDEVKTIAYCSQYVDDNDQTIDVYEDEFCPNSCYQNKISQTMNILLPRTDLLDIYPLFHFIPGDQADAPVRVDKQVNVLNTTPGSSNAKAIMKGAVDKYLSRDPRGIYRLGIAVHTFVDTWAHQNFAGCKDDFNGIAGVSLPNVGHADAMHHPDWVAHRWTDSRLEQPEIDNNTRFFAASRQLFDVFKGSLGKAVQKGEWENVQDTLQGIWGKTYSGDSERGLKNRVDMYQQIIPFLPKYDNRDLEDSALELKYIPDDGNNNYGKKYVWKNGIEPKTTPWYQFQEAVKEHIDHSKDVLKHVLALAKIV